MRKARICTIIVVLFTAYSSNVIACQDYLLEGAFNKADLVVVGVVTQKASLPVDEPAWRGSNPDWTLYGITVEITRILKGEAQKEIVVTHSGSSCTAIPYLEVGEVNLYFLAEADSKGWYVSESPLPVIDDFNDELLQELELLGANR